MFAPRQATFALMAAGLVFGAAALAPSSPSMAQQNSMPSPQQDFEQGELQSFAQATIAVQQIGQEFQPRMQEAETVNEREALQEQQMEQMVGAVESTGLSVQEYNQIHAAVQSDPELAAEMEEYFGQAQ